MSSKYAYQSVPEEYYFGEFVNVEDIGEQIRKEVKSLTNPAGLTDEVTEQLAKKIDSLERLASNIYATKYKRTYTSTATGLSAEQCSQVLSSEFLQYLNDESKKKKQKKTDNQ